MKASLSILLLLTVILSAFAGNAFAAGSRIDGLVEKDVTERLETIYELKKSLKDLGRELAVYNTALEEAQKKKNHKRVYVNTRKVADAITALTILGGSIASYYVKNEMKLVKIASFIGGLSTSTSVLTSLLADLSTDQAEAIKSKIDDLLVIIKATNTNLGKEIKLLCAKEASNQMCR